MAKLYTRKGDEGTTVLFDGTKVRKDDRHVSACGTIDELNAHLGVTVSSVASAIQARPAESAWKILRERIVRIQAELFALGAELATPAGARKRGDVPIMSSEQVSRLEAWIDEAAARVAPLSVFIVPGGHVVASHLHVCRTVCRRAERCVVGLTADTPVNPQVLKYLNRSSDLLFAWARWANHLAGVADVRLTRPPKAESR